MNIQNFLGVFLIFSLPLTALCAPVFSSSESHYDEIVDDLQRETSQHSISSETLSNKPYPWEIHGGLLFSTTYMDLRNHSGLWLSGFELTVGFNFWNSSWNFESSLREGSSFLSSDSLHMDFLEINLKTFYAYELSTRERFKLGLGMGGAFITFEELNKTQKETDLNLLVFGGYDYFMTADWSLGLEVSSRHPLSYKSLDTQTYGLGLKLDTHF